MDAAPPPRHHIEVSASAAWVRSTVDVDEPGKFYASRSGIGFSTTLAYASPYFLTPFLELGNWPIASSARATPLGVVDSRMSTLGIAAGPGVDVWKLRIRAGVGVYFVNVHSKLAGETVTPSEHDMGYLLGVGVTVLRRGRIAIQLDARGVYVVEANIGFFTVGPQLTFDMVRWH